MVFAEATLVNLRQQENAYLSYCLLINKLIKELVAIMLNKRKCIKVHQDSTMKMAASIITLRNMISNIFRRILFNEHKNQRCAQLPICNHELRKEISTIVVKSGHSTKSYRFFLICHFFATLPPQLHGQVHTLTSETKVIQFSSPNCRLQQNKYHNRT